MRLTLLAVIGAAMALLILGVFGPKARAHNAPSGWAYPVECCHDTAHECFQITEEDLVFEGDKITIKATGEIFTAPDRSFVNGSRGYAKWSGDAQHPDGDYHRCTFHGEKTSVTYCLYLPRPSI